MSIQEIQQASSIRLTERLKQAREELHFYGRYEAHHEINAIQFELNQRRARL